MFRFITRSLSCKTWRFLCPLFISFVCTANLHANPSVEQWRAAEISLTSAASYANPYLDNAITATFTGPNNMVVTRPGFWDGGNVWKVRFAPTVMGTWTYTVASQNTSDSGLHNQTGSVQCVAYTGSLPIYQKGFIKKSANNRHFVYGDGSPFFYLADTQWFMHHVKWGTSNAPGTTSMFKTIIDRRVDQGFSVIQSHPDGHRLSMCNTGGTEIYVAKFQDYDLKVQYIADKGLVHNMGIGAFHHTEALSGPGAQRLARYFVARYGAYPVLWFTAQEVDLAAANLQYVWKDASATINTHDAYSHPQSVHMWSPGEPTIFATEPWHDWFMTQGGHDVVRSIAHYKFYWDYSPARPFLESENNYEGLDNLNPASMVRRAAYKSIQTGGLGYGYGAQGIWNSNYSASDYGATYGGYKWWYDGLYLAGGEHMRHLGNFYRSLEWWKLVPRFTDANWAVFSNPETSVLKTDGNRLYVAYFYATSTATGTLRQLDGTSTYTARWFNPRTGSYTNISGAIQPTSGEWSVPAKPDAEDWILVAMKNGVGPNLALNKTYNSSSSWNSAQSAQYAFDGSYSTNWQAASGQFAGSRVEVNFGANTAFNTVVLSEFGSRTSGFRIEYWNGSNWLTAATGTAIGSTATPSVHSFPAVTGSKARIFYTAGSQQPILYEFEVYNYVPPANLARNKTYASSSNWNSAQAAPFAFDGLYNTNWQAASGQFANSWLEVDFGASTLFNRAVLSEYGSRTTGFRIEYWNGAGWLTAFTGTSIGSTSNPSLHTFSPVAGSKARIYFTAGSQQPILYEFEVYNDGPPPNLALGKSYSSSSNWNASQTAPYAFDGLYNTNWQAASGQFANSWVEVNLGANTTFNKVVLSEYGSRTTGFRIEYWNGSAWSTAFTGSTIGNTGNPSVHTFTAVLGSKVRVFYTSGSQQPILYEFEVYND